MTNIYIVYGDPVLLHAVLPFLLGLVLLWVLALSTWNILPEGQMALHYRTAFDTVQDSFRYSAGQLAL